MYQPNNSYNNTYVSEFEEKVVQINRIAKKTKGGTQMRFSALMVIGDRKSRVGVGLAKARDVRSAVQKAATLAKRNMITVPMKGTSVPFEIYHKYGAAKILIKPAPAGSGIIAGGPMRVVFECAGIRDVVAKILGTKNKIANVYATIEALDNLARLADKKAQK
jgi:small subunit ribosomal protein S5